MGLPRNPSPCNPAYDNCCLVCLSLLETRLPNVDNRMAVVKAGHFPWQQVTVPKRMLTQAAGSTRHSMSESHEGWL